MTVSDDLVQRVTERLLEVEKTEQYAPVLTAEAAIDARQLLCQAAPDPEQIVLFGPVHLALCTFYLRAAAGDQNPTALADNKIATALYIFLRHELADISILPEFPPEVMAATLDESERRSSFALVIAGSCVLNAGDAFERGAMPEVWDALSQGIAWLLNWYPHLRVRHGNYPDLVCLLSVLFGIRFDRFADPRDFAAAVDFALAACRHVAPSHTRVGPQLPNMLAVLVEGAWMLGYPDPESAEDITRRSGIEPLPATLERLKHIKALREAIHTTASIPEPERDAVTALLMCQAQVFKGDLPSLSCTVARLETALAAFPQGHPRHGPAVWLLHRGYERLGWDSSGLPEPDVAGRFYGAALQLSALFDVPEETTPPADELADLLERLLALGEELAVGHGFPGLPPEVRAAIAFTDSLLFTEEGPGDRALERVGRHRRALEALEPGHPARLSYSLILATEASDLSAALAGVDSARSETIAKWAQEAITEIASIVAEDDGPELLASLRSGDTAEPLIFGLLTLPLRWQPETRQVLEAIDSDALVFVAGIFGAAAKHAGDELENRSGDESGRVHALRNLVGLSRYGGERPLEADAEDVDRLLTLFAQDPELAEISRAGGDLLAARLGRVPFGSVSEETLAGVAKVLQKIYDATDQPSWLLEDRLLGVWSQIGLMQMDPTMIMMADAISHEAENAQRTDEHPDAVSRFNSALQRVNVAIYSYMFAHEPAALDRARAAMPALLGLARAADAEKGPHRDCQVRAEMVRDLADVMGPGGGPKEDITDEVLERCRAAYQNSPDDMVRMFTAGNLSRALLSRSSALRKSDPEAARRLIDEAKALQGPFYGTGFQETLLGRLGELTLPGGSATSETSASPPRSLADLAKYGPLREIMDLLPATFAGTPGSVEQGEAEVKAMRSPLIPMWFRAQIGVLAALEAANVYPDGVERALDIGAEAIGLLEQLTDRGGSEQAAEHSLLSFDGRVRQLATLLAHNARIPRGMLESQESRPLHEAFGEIAEIFTKLSMLYKAAEARGIALPQPPGMPATVSGPLIDSIVATLERGRGLLLGRRLESRADLGPLRAAHPELADRFEDLTSRLRSGDGPVQGRARVQGRQASTEFDALVAQIRTKAGFEDFLTPQSPEQLRALASQGPIIILNHTDDFYCVAFLISEDEIRSCYIEVEGKHVTDAAQRLARAIEACYSRGRRKPGPSAMERVREEITEVFSWSWHKIVEPILRQLGCFEPECAGRDRPRVWWVPTGPFNALPLHAVQCMRENCSEEHCGSALDTVVSSYVPGLQTLAHTRARAAHQPRGQQRRALVVAETDDVLPGAVAAADYAAGALGSGDVLIGDSATHEEVLRALEHSPWVQFSCHAHSSPDLPAGSWIQLPGGDRLSVTDIYRTRPESAQMAILTACGTARTAEHLADEAVPVTSAFLLAGYPAAVGTLWEVDSTQIEPFLRGFYTRVLDGSSSAAHAVHHAARDLREKYSDQPHVWAAYVHAGH